MRRSLAATGIGAVALAVAFAVPPAPAELHETDDAPGAPLPARDAPALLLPAPRSLEDVLAVDPGVPAERLREEAERARTRGERFRAYALATLALRSYDSRAASGSKEARKLAERRAEWTRDLFAEEAACAAAWCGVTPELSLQFARAMAANGFADDAATEVSTLLEDSRLPPKTRREASELLGSLPQAKSRSRSNGTGGAHASVYRVAALLPQSGDYAVYGHSLLAGLRIALEDSLVKSNDLPVRVDVYDTQADPVVTARAARAALESGCGVVVGETLSLPTFVLGGICADRGVALLSPSATDERIGEIGPLVLQTGVSRAAQAWALAEYAGWNGGAKRVAIALSAGGEASEFSVLFRAAAESLGVETVEMRTPSGRRDAADAMSALAKAEVDALLLPDDPGAAELWFAALGKDPPKLWLLASETLDLASLSAEARRRTEGLTLVGLEYALSDSTFARVDAASRSRFGVEADRFVRRGFLTGRAIRRALSQRAASPAALARALTPGEPATVASGGDARRFVRFSEREATVPISAWRRGQLVRLR